MLNGKSVLITGGTGSLGQALVAEIYRKYPEIDRLIVFSRDELKQYDMRQTFPEKKYPSLRFFLGDVRDRDRLRRAFNRVNIVIHAAALKQVPAAEYNPMEFIHTNIGGAENVIEAAIDAGVEKVIALSTDKAAAPVNLYGATKLCSDKLFISAASYSGSQVCCAVVRYGNVMASRGSVVPFFINCAKSGILPVTHQEMTRFNITLQEGIDLIFHVIENAQGGEVFVPRIPSYRVTDLAEAIGPSCKKEVIGMRPGEKIHEEMITSSDSYSTVELGAHFIILPQSTLEAKERFHERYPTEFVEPGFSYNSKDNSRFLSVDEIRHLIREHVDSRFEPI